MIETRNFVVNQLSEHLKIKIAYSNQNDEELKSPYGYYTPINPQEIVTQFGNTTFSLDGDNGITTLQEEALMTLSFTFVSNGTTEGISAIDEAALYADKALKWLRHIGTYILEDENIVLERFTGIRQRTIIELEERTERYGFDATFRYAVESLREEITISEIIIREKDVK